MLAVRIEAAAVRIGEMIHTLPAPARHYEVHRLAGGEGEEGFATSDGGFVGRAEAAQVALAAGQISTLRDPPLLYCCDLFRTAKRR